MDPFSFASGSIGIIAVTTTVVSSLANVIHSFSTASESVVSLRDELNSLSHVLQGLNTCGINPTASLASLLGSIGSVVTELRRIIDSCVPKGDSFIHGWGSKLEWMMCQNDVKDLTLALHNYKDTLILELSTQAYKDNQQILAILRRIESNQTGNPPKDQITTPITHPSYASPPSSSPDPASTDPYINCGQSAYLPHTTNSPAPMYPVSPPPTTPGYPVPAMYTPDDPPYQPYPTATTYPSDYPPTQDYSNMHPFPNSQSFVLYPPTPTGNNLDYNQSYNYNIPPVGAPPNIISQPYYQAGQDYGVQAPNTPPQNYQQNSVFGAYPAGYQYPGVGSPDDVHPDLKNPGYMGGRAA